MHDVKQYLDKLKRNGFFLKIKRPIKHKMDYYRSSLAVKCSGRNQQSKKILLQYKNRYPGQRCFILGNGPSLTINDLNWLKGEITFASNRIYKAFDQTDWRPTFYAIFDESVGETEGLAEEVSKLQCIKFCREQGYYIFHDIKGEVCWLHSYYGRKYIDHPKFSEDLLDGVYALASVTYTMIQIARWMGFSEIYLLGCDNRYAYTITRDGKIKRNENVMSYFYNTSMNEADALKAAEPWGMNIIFEFAEKYSREHGFRIYNATRGGFLEAFERVKMDDLIGATK